MIAVEKPDPSYLTCQCCFSKDGVLSIYFRANNAGTEVRLCRKCQQELIEELKRHGDQDVQGRN